MILHRPRPKPARHEPRHAASDDAPAQPHPADSPFAAASSAATGRNLQQPHAGPQPRFIPNPPPETCTACGCDLEAGWCGWCQPRQPVPDHTAARLAAVVFWHDRRDLPAFAQTVRVRGWNGLHLRAPAGLTGGHHG